MLYAISLEPDHSWSLPKAAKCYELWDKYEMLENIRVHSTMVAKTALYIARDVLEKRYEISEDYVIAAALLHDIAKTYTIKHGGDHAQLGAAFVRAETGNPYLAHAVASHVLWPWSEGKLSVEHKPWRLPLLISYADKRVCHDKIVSLDERFGDLMQRYGKTERSRKYIQENYEQSIDLEKSFKKRYIQTDLDFSKIKVLQID